MRKLTAVIVLLLVLATLLGGCAANTATPSWSSLLVVGETLYSGSQVGRVYALNALSGAEIWQFTSFLFQKSLSTDF